MRIEAAGSFTYIHADYRHPRLDEAAARLHGKWWGKGRYYCFPAAATAEITALVAELTVPQTTLSAAITAPVEQVEAMPEQVERSPRTGWSKASGRRRSHPLGEVVEAGGGYTVYEDTAFGGGRVQIWDQS